MKIAVIFEHFGPYHIARLRGAMYEDANVQVVPIELFGKCQTYAWNKPETHEDNNVRVVFADGDAKSVAKKAIRDGLEQVLNDIAPDVIAVHGWSLPGASDAIGWANKNGVALIVMSESRANDSPRSSVKEFIKRQILATVDAGLVGAPSHAKYLTQLGIPSDGIFTGYNAVDNDYFAREASRVRVDGQHNRLNSLPDHFPQKFFFASNRFVEKKNLNRLIQAYAKYQNNNGLPWGLVLAGDGPLRKNLVAQVDSLGLQELVHFPGFLQYDKLPTYYGLACAFVHVSTVEQWGLVVNEAAASGLPLIVSETTGCAECLIDHGRNGFLCDSLDTDSIAASLTKVAALSEKERAAMGVRSQQIVSNFGPKQFGQGLIGAAKHAMENPRKASLMGRLIVALLS